jgi:Uma2 family endonuclease
MITTITTSPLTLDDFLALPESDVTYELLDGQAISKMSPNFRHSRSQKKLLFLLDAWATDKGFVQPEWAVRLQRNGNDWVPVPDLLYISFERLSPDWDEDAPCPIAPELVIEIVSPGPSFGAIAEKASAYLLAGVLRVWVVDSQHQSLTVFAPDQMPRIYRQLESIEDSLFPELSLLTGDIF